MSRISSTVSEVEALRFEALPAGKKVAITAAVRVGKTHVFMDAKGNVYSTQVKQRSFYTLSSGLEETLNGCKALGLLSKEAVKKHQDTVQAVLLKRNKRFAAESLIEHAETLGIKLTAAQSKAVEAAK